MPRGDWSLEVCVRHLETGKGETGRPWLSTVCVPLCHSKPSREKELSFHRFPKCESKKKKWKVKIRRDEGELVTLTEHTRVCSLHLRVMVGLNYFISINKETRLE